MGTTLAALGSGALTGAKAATGFGELAKGLSTAGKIGQVAGATIAGRSTVGRGLNMVNNLRDIGSGSVGKPGSTVGSLPGDKNVGKQITDLAKQLGMDKSDLLYWVEQYNKQGGLGG